MLAVVAVPEYEFLGLTVRDGILTPDRPFDLPEDCLTDLLGMLTSQGWALDPNWHPSDPQIVLRRQVRTIQSSENSLLISER